MKKYNYQLVLTANEKKCDFCHTMAKYDGKTKQGPWAFMCNQHFKIHGVGLGEGKGQQLMLQEEYEQPKYRM
jgi:hypothetical protein